MTLSVVSFLAVPIVSRGGTGGSSHSHDNESENVPLCSITQSGQTSMIMENQDTREGQVNPRPTKEGWLPSPDGLSPAAQRRTRK